MPFIRWEGYPKQAKTGEKSIGYTAPDQDIEKAVADLMAAGWHDTDLTIASRLIGRIEWNALTHKLEWVPVDPDAPARRSTAAPRRAVGRKRR